MHFKNAKHWNLHEHIISLPSFALDNKIRKLKKWVTDQSGFVEKQEEINVCKRDMAEPGQYIK